MSAYNPRYAAHMAHATGSEIRELLKLIERPGMISFAGGIPDPDLFPVDAIRKIQDALFKDSRTARRALQYSASEGDPELRGWIADHMSKHGVPCALDNILITSGSQQAIDFAGKLFVSPGCTVQVAKPTYLGALQALEPYQPNFQTQLLSPSVGSNRFDQGDHYARKHALAYVVPDFSNPTGHTLSKADRFQLLSMARTLDIPIVEDSPYEMLRFEGTPECAIQTMDIDEVGSISKSRVIYCGSFSKVFTPGLRLGWVCAAEEIIRRMTLLKQSSDLNSSALNQKTMFHLANGHYETQVTRVRSVYKKKRDVMLANLADVLPPGTRWSRPNGGMFIWVELPEGYNATKLLKTATNDYGVAFVPGKAFHSCGNGHNTLRLSFSLPDLKSIREGALRLGSLFSEIKI